MNGSNANETGTSVEMEALFDYMFSAERETIKGEPPSICCPNCPQNARERNCFMCGYKRM